MQSNLDPFTQSIGMSFNWDGSLETVKRNLVQLIPVNSNKHTVIIGPTGCGKSNLMTHMKAKDVRRGHSVVDLDLRGDSFNSALQLCAGNVDPNIVALIDLREKIRPFGFNPLFGRGESYFRALCFLAILQTQSGSWGIQLAETLRCALMVLAECGEPITHLERLLYDQSFRRHCLSRCSDEPVISFWLRYDRYSPDKQNEMAMPVLNKVSLLLSTKSLRNIVGHPQPLNLGEHLDTPGSILLVSLAVDELHGAGRMMGDLILASICQEVFSRVNTSETERNPVRLYVDEFENFTMPEFETILAEGRRFGFSLVMAFQSLAQISPKMRSLILANVGTKIVFQCGREDEAVLSRDIFGRGTVYDLSQLNVGEALIWQRGQMYDFVEINEPILPNGGGRNEEAERFAKQVYSRVTPLAELERNQPGIIPTHVSESIISAEMEEWL